VPFVISIQLYDTHQSHLSVPERPLKDEVIFCVQGVVSPLLANIYLHYVFDLWAQQWRQRHATGDVIVVRYADDSIIGFQHRQDAERFLHDLKERLARFALSLHPDKTRLIEFGRFAAGNRRRRSEGKTGDVRLPRIHALL